MANEQIWHTKSLSEIGTIITGSTPKTSNKDYWNGPYSFVSPSDMLGKKRIYTTGRKVTIKGLESGRPIPQNSLMVTCIASIGKMGISTEKCLTNQQINTLIPNVNYDVDFLYYLLSHNIEHLKILAGQTAVPIINKSLFSEFQVAIPSYSVQRKMAAIISAVDDAIERTEAVIERTEKVKQGLMQQLFTKGAGHTKFKQTSLGEIPETWKVKRMSDLFERITRKNDLKEEYPVLTISAKEGLVDQKTRFNRVIAGKSLEKYTMIYKNEFAYNRGNSKTFPMGVIYRFAKYDKGLVPFVYYCFKAKEDNIDHDFYQYYFLAQKLNRQLSRVITSSARQDGLMNISAADFFNLLIPFPKKEEQELIANYLIAIDQRIALENRKLDQLNSLKSGLMQSLLTGKVKVKVDESEVTNP